MKEKITQKIGIFTFFMLITVFAVYLYSPVIRSHAAETSRTLEVNAEITSMISMNSIPITSITAARGEFNTTTVPVTVDTNSPYGYSLMMEDLDIESSLVNQASENHKITSTFSGAKTATTMDVNNWGYSMDGTNYYSIPTFGNAIRIKNTAAPTVTSDITSVGLGIKVGKALAAGTYVDYLLFTAITNGQDGNPYQTITRDMTMQGFDFKKAYGQTYMLTDVRNNKTYEVKSLMDGSYWMLENLDLSNITVDSTDSGFDGSGDFTIPASLSSWTLSDEVPEVYTTNIAKYGTYYNFVAATADNSSNGYSTGSICPDGWEIPTTSDFLYLIEAYGADDIASILKLEKSGYYDVDNGVFGQGETGAWWLLNRGRISGSGSSSASAVNAFKLNSDGSVSQAEMDKRSGLGIRCYIDSYSYPRK